MNPTNIISRDALGELSAFFGQFPELTDSERNDLELGARELEKDPDFHVELQKAKFAEAMLEALAERQESKSDLAKRWGRSRQYVSKLLHAERRVNLTVKSMVELAFQLDRQIEIVVTRTSSLVNSQVTTIYWEEARRSWEGTNFRRRSEIGFEPAFEPAVLLRPSDSGIAKYCEPSEQVGEYERFAA
ncbi:MAG: hypothetical protein AB7O66_11610 [Limisphaerales bacterium]